MKDSDDHLRPTVFCLPDDSAAPPESSTPVESAAEVGSRSVALHTLSKAITDSALCGQMYPCRKSGGMIPGGRMNHPDAPNRLSP